MGWRDLFKSKTTKVEPDPRLRWFGKLPTYADYYKSPSDVDWTVEFNDWLLKGCELYYARRRGDGPPRLPSIAAAVRLPKAGMTVCASIQDYGGDMRGRPFPLAFYVGVPTEAWPGPTSGRALAVMKVLRNLRDLRDQVARFFNAPGRFETLFGNREVDVAGMLDEAADDSWQRAAQALPLDTWFGGARVGLKEQDAGRWTQLAGLWGESIAKYESDDFTPTFRLPLVYAQGFEAQVAGWLCWLERRMDLERRALTLFVSHEQGAEVGYFGLVARDVEPQDLLVATPLAGTLSYLDDLCAVGGEAAEKAESLSSVGEDAPAALSSVPGTWADFVAGKA